MAIRGGVRLPRRFWATARLCQVSASLRPCGHLDKSCAASCETARASLPNQASGELLRIRVCGASPMDFGPVYGASSARCGRPNRFVPANPSDCRTGSPCRDQAPGTANLSKLVTADQYPPSRPAAPCAVSLSRLECSSAGSPARPSFEDGCRPPAATTAGHRGFTWGRRYVCVVLVLVPISPARCAACSLVGLLASRRNGVPR